MIKLLHLDVISLKTNCCELLNCSGAWNLCTNEFDLKLFEVCHEC